MNEKEWTVMIYMAGDNNLAVDMAYAMEQIKDVAAEGTESPNLLVYYDGNSPAIPTLYCDFSEPRKPRYVRSYKVPKRQRLSWTDFLKTYLYDVSLRKFEKPADDVPAGSKFRYFSGVRFDERFGSALSGGNGASNTKIAGQEGTKISGQEGTKISGQEGTKIAGQEGTKIAGQEGTKLGGGGASAFFQQLAPLQKYREQVGHFRVHEEN